MNSGVWAPKILGAQAFPQVLSLNCPLDQNRVDKHQLVLQQLATVLQSKVGRLKKSREILKLWSAPSRCKSKNTMPTLSFFRDILALDSNLVTLLSKAKLTPKPGDTIMLGARNCTISTLPGDFNYVIAADKLSLKDATSLKIGGTANNKSPSITILAVEIDGAFNLAASGLDGTPGAHGIKGKDSEIITFGDKPKGSIPPEPGRPGGNGGPGSPGGRAVIHYAVAAQAPVASAPGGHGGAAGPGGAPGNGTPPAAKGTDGKAGAVGAPGFVEVSKVDATKVWTPLDVASARAWASYRTEVGSYFFRLFDFESQILALREFSAALQLDPTNADAQTLRDRIIQQQTPTGLSRDIDISPDYKDLASNLPDEAVLVQNAFATAASALQQLDTAEALQEQFKAMVQQLTDRQAEAKDNVILAQEDLTIANQEDELLSKQISSIKNQIQALQNQSFSLGTFLTDVASVAASIASVATGVGAVVSIPGSIIAIDKLANDSGGILAILKGLAEDQKNDPGKSLHQDLSKIGVGLSDLVKLQGNVGTVLANFSKIEAELDGAGGKADQTQAAQLLKQFATLQVQEMIARLRQKQAQDRVAAAKRTAQDFANEAKKAQTFSQSLSKDADFLEGAVDSFISMARQLTDIVAEDVFVARRSLEIYELDDASDVRFDYGYLHPDDDNHSLPALQRVTESQQSVATLAPAILTWNDIFNQLNAAQASGFDVVHPAISISITDPVVLAHLSTGNGLQFSIDVDATPSSIFELKVNSLELELDGASATSPVMFWIEHSGHWKMVPRPVASAHTDAALVEFTLFPHVEIFNCKASAGTLSATIPENPQSSAEPGPPFSFWGRGVIADYRIYPDPSARGLDLSKLTALKLSISCIGFARQGAAQSPPKVLKPVPVLLPGRTFASTSGIVHRANA